MYTNKRYTTTVNLVLAFLLALSVAFNVSTAAASNNSTFKGKKIGKFLAGGKNCTLTSRAALQACRNEKGDDAWISIGNCANLPDSGENKICLKETRVTYKEELKLCREQFDARQEICDILGEDPYYPDLSPASFVDPADIDSSNANPYWPLIPGTQWVYEGQTDEGLEVITVTVTDVIKEIEYPADSGQIFRCTEVMDLVTLDGEFIEDTKDWYAQDNAGNVWYFGEIARNFEDGELVDVEGSWRAGIDGARPGILMLIFPQADEIYRQEFLLGDAEDMAEVVSVGEATVTVPYGSFDTDVLVTNEYTPIDPEVSENKYYAPGIGMVLEENLESGERVELVELTQP